MTREEKIKNIINTVDSIVEDYYLKKFKSNITDKIVNLNYNCGLFLDFQESNDLDGQKRSLENIVVYIKELRGKISYNDFARLTEACHIIDAEIVMLALEITNEN